MWVMGGGRDAPNPSNEVDSYDRIQNSWTIGGHFLTPRRNFATDTAGECYIYVAGGYASDGVTPLSSMEIFCFPRTLSIANSNANGNGDTNSHCYGYAESDSDTTVSHYSTSLSYAAAGRRASAFERELRWREANSNGSSDAVSTPHGSNINTNSSRYAQNNTTSSPHAAVNDSNSGS
jgi:hypothetical protein